MDRRQGWQGGKDLIRIVTGQDGHTRGNQHVFGLKPADQVQLRLMNFAVKAETHGLAVGIITAPQDLKFRVSGCPDGQNIQPTIGRDICHLFAARAVDVDHRGGIRRQDAREQSRLGVEVVVEVGVIIQMILREVRKRPHLEDNAIQTTLPQTV